MPGIHLDVRQILSQIGRKFSDSVNPRARSPFEAVELIDGHHDMPPSTAMRNRNRGNERCVLNFSKPSLEVLRTELFQISHMSPDNIKSMNYVIDLFHVFNGHDKRSR